MSDDNEEAVYNKAAELLDGEDFSWIRIIHETGFLTVLQLLALVLHALRNGDQTRDRKKGFAQWVNKIEDDIHGGQIALVDHHSHLSIQIPVSEESYPALLLRDADFLFEEGHMGSSCSELVEEIFKRKFPEEAQEPNSDNNKLNVEELRAKNRKLKQKPAERQWGYPELKSLWEESLLPGVTHHSLAKKHEVSRQRISTLLKKAKAIFPRFPGKPAIPAPSKLHLMDSKVGGKNKQ